MTQARHGGQPELSVTFDHQIFAQQAYGGISRYFAAIAGLLPEHGVEPRFPFPFHINRHAGHLPRRILPGVRIPASRLPSAAARLVDSLAVRVATRAVPADVFHETYYSDQRRSPRGMPVALTVYDMIHELFPNPSVEDPTASLKRSAVARADRILCISECTKRDLIALYPEVEPKCAVTLLGFDSRPLSQAPRPLERPYLLFVGLRGGYKNFAGLIEALASAPALVRNFDLVCIGGGAFTNAEEAAINAIRAMGGRVSQVNATDEQLPAWYRHAEAFIYPSLYEGFGIPPLEAMAQDCPVVCFKVASVPEVCGDAARYASDTTPEALASAIEAVIGDAEEAGALRRRGSEQLGRFSWDRCAAQTAAIYRSMQ